MKARIGKVLMMNTRSATFSTVSGFLDAYLQLNALAIRAYAMKRPVSMRGTGLGWKPIMFPDNREGTALRTPRPMNPGTHFAHLVTVFHKSIEPSTNSPLPMKKYLKEAPSKRYFAN